ncbi:hypothetical protein Tco_0934902 [Tanacetum coccineum]
MSTEMLLAKEKLIKAIRTCLKNNNQPPEEKSIAVLLAEKSILTVMQTLEEKQNDTERKSRIIKSHPSLPNYGSLVIEDEHLDTIPEMDSDEEIESSVENLNLTPNFLYPLFDSNADYTTSNDESSSEEDVLVENFKIYSNPLLEFDEEIFSSEINPLYNEVSEDLDSIPPGNENDHFNDEFDLIESLLNKDTVITSQLLDFLLRSSPVSSLLSIQFHRELLKPTLIRRKLLILLRSYYMITHLFALRKSLILKMILKKENSGSTTIHTDIYLLEYESFDDESDSASEIFNDDLAHIISPSEYEYIYADDESDSGDLSTNVVEDILGDSTRKLQMSHWGFTALKISHNFFNKSPMMIYGGDIPILDVSYLHFYPL